MATQAASLEISLHGAASKGLTETVARLLDQGVPVDQTDDQGATALHLAVKEGHVDIPHMAPMPSAAKPVHLAAMTLNPAMMEAVLQHRPNLESRVNGLTALFLATSAGDEGVVRLLLDAGADARARTTCQVGTGESVLHMAAGSFKNSLLPLLIAHGADVNVAGTNPMGQTALHIAAEYGNTEAMAELIASGTNMYAKFPDGRTALEVAAQQGHIKAASVLIDHGMDPLAKFDGKYSAVYMSAVHGKTELVRWFFGPIDMVVGAAGTNRISILEMLDKKGFPMTDLDDSGVSALYLALHYEHHDAVVYMLRRGADPDPYIPQDPNSWALQDATLKEGIDLLRTAKRQREFQPNAELFPEWRYKVSNSTSLQAQIMAHAVSINATRPVEANQEPAGVFSCTVCRDLDFRRGMPRNAEVVYYIGMERMHSAASHCRGCRSGVTWPTVGTGRDVSVQDWGDARASIAKRFLEECTTNHTDCQFRLGKLPTRVIRIPSTGEPHLYVSKGEKARYMALSHCWGGISPLTTTTATLSQRLREIPFADLPKTFQDAVTITRSLGVGYLWIDSLCIIQDDRDDWAREAARMKDVYAGCYAMISANGSTNSNGGCFGSGISEQKRSFAVHSVGPFFSKVKAFVRLTHLRDTFHAEVGHIIGDDTGPLAGGRSRTRLNQRGWCFQERVLAPRILHLGPSELAWECPETVACECQCVVTRHDRESRFKALFADRILRNAQQPHQSEQADARPQVDILLWMHFVEEFTRRELTYSTDTLHALSGLAEFMGAVAQTDYLCGLWKKNLAEFLLWRVPVPNKLFSDSRRMSGAGTGTDAVLAKHHATYHAPSWSWASVIGPIDFDIGRLDMGEGDQVSHVRKDGMLEKATTRHSLLEDDPASLTIRGPTIIASWTGKRDAADPLAKQKSEQVLTYTATSSGSAVTLTADFTPDPLGEEVLGISIGDELLLLATILDEKAVVPHKDNNSVYGVERATVTGLVLALGAAFPAGGLLADQGDDRPVYRRVGLFSVNADDWSRVQRTRTVVIM
ncbi:hypothetical protein B0I37DRAFT_400223 [Chaetomium sp. MPI-CAGE-AT-0009]|nr:hypothetical protein B0I37DRAFT_400223 [Chaetomium sp. MPI-CAGE-AT-0009]